jgi:hypothetical protein
VILNLRDSRRLALHGMIAGRIAIVCQPIKIQHLILQDESPSVGLGPRASAELWNRSLSNPFSRMSAIPMICFTFIKNAIRRGAVMEILLQYSCLANSHDTWLGGERGPLYIMFNTLLKGPHGCDTLQHRFTDTSPLNLIREVMRDSKNQCRFIRWNPVLPLVGLHIIRDHLPLVYHLLLGINYFTLAKMPLSMWLLIVLHFSIVLKFTPVPFYVGLFVTAPLVQKMLLEVFWKPLGLDSVIPMPLNYALAWLGN